MTDLVPKIEVDDYQVQITYACPKRSDYERDSFPGDNLRAFTIIELEEILWHARSQDASDDTYVTLELVSYRNNDYQLKVVIPRHWDDISDPLPYRYQPVKVALHRKQSWRYGFLVGIFIASIIWSLIIGLT